MSYNRFLLNCFPVEFSVSSIDVVTSAWNQDIDMRVLREEVGNDWFVFRRGDTTTGMPLVANPATAFGSMAKTLQLNGYEGLDFMRACLNEALPKLLPKYTPQRVRPFQFLAQKDEFVSSFASNHQVPALVQQGFEIHPRFELDARIIELIEGQLQVVVVMSVGMHWSVTADLLDLVNAGVSLEGMYVIHKNPTPGERKLAGRIKSVKRKTALLDEVANNNAVLDIATLQLEGSRTNFKKCLAQLIGGLYKTFEFERENWEAGFTKGTSLAQNLSKFIGDSRQIQLTPNVSATITKAMHIRNIDGANIYTEIPPVEY